MSTANMDPEEPPKQTCSKRKDPNDVTEGVDQKRARTTSPEKDVKPVEVIYVSHEEIMQKLRDAVQARDATLLRELLKHKPKLSSPECGELLWIVIEDADTEIATILVNAGTNVNIKNKKDPLRPFLLHALAKKADDPRKLALMDLLLDHGAKINCHDKSARGILDYAVAQISEPFNVYKELRKRGAAVGPSVLSALAAKPNYVDYLSLFVWGSEPKDKADLKVRNSAVAAINLLTYFQGDESLILPAVRWLLDIKPSVRRLSGDALFGAVLHRKVGMVKLLIEYGVDMNLNAQKGHSLICMALQHDKPAMAELLIHYGANIHSRTNYQRYGKSDECYPIHVACDYGRENNIQLLLRAGINIKVVDGNGESPFSAIHDRGTLSDAHRTMIKHFGLMLAKGLTVLQNDLEIIGQRQYLMMFYRNCWAELEKMKASKILTSFSCFSFFTEDVRRITLLIKNQNFLDNFNKYQINVSFPLYFSEIEWVIENAVKRKDILALKEEAFYEKVGKFLPSLVIEKIMNYLCLIDD